MKRATSWISVLTPGDGDERHGHNGYSNLGCRCEICRAANTAYNLARRERRTKALLADPSIRPHGAYATYVNYGCRCPECKAVNASRGKASRRAKTT